MKFIRFGQWRIEQTGEGVLAFITNNSYLDAPTFRGMRQNLMTTFNDIYILNLHGDSRKSVPSANGQKDENVFDIVQGVSIVILVKQLGNIDCNVFYFDLKGKRNSKYRFLDFNDFRDVDWQLPIPSQPHYLFKPINLEHRSSYTKFYPIEQCFSASSMAITIQKKNVSFLHDKRDKIHYRVFDIRFIDYDLETITRPRFEIMRHLYEVENLALITLRRPRINLFGNFWVTDHITDKSVITSKDNAYVFPLYLYPDPAKFDMGDDPSEFPLSHKGRRPNLSRDFVADMEAKLGLRFVTEGAVLGTGSGFFGPEDVFYYAYAIFHSPTYRQRYAEFLKIDFPRLPLTSDVGLFAALVELGAQLVSLHLMKSPRLAQFMTSFDVEGDNEVARGYPKYVERGGRVYINKRQYFGGVPAEIWDFYIGGYQVAHKWLKDRRGRVLSYADLRHYQRIIVALAETQRIMTAIDAAIPGFPIE